MNNSPYDFVTEANLDRELLAKLVESAFSGVPVDDVTTTEPIDYEIADKLVIFIKQEVDRLRHEIAKNAVEFLEQQIDTHLTEKYKNNG